MSYSQLNISQVASDSDIDDLIGDITLKHARTPYTIYICEMFEKEKAKDKNARLADISKKYGPKWTKVSDSEKKRYQEIHEEEKEKFIADVNTVKHYLIGDFIQEGATAYRIYLHHCLKQAFEEDKDPKEVKKKAKQAWEKMSKEERKEWRSKTRENNDWWDKARRSGNINAFSVFIQKKITDTRDSDDQLTFSDCSKLWRKLSDKDKKKYKKIAEEMNEERRQMREIYEIANGIKPKRPMGAYHIFLSEKAKEGKFSGKKNALLEGRKLWEKLKEEEKDHYLKLSHKLRLCYLYKSMLYKKKLRKNRLSKPKSAYNFFVQEMKGKKPKNQKFMEFVVKEWEKLSDKEKNKYYEKAEAYKLKFMKEKEMDNSRVYEAPKKPAGSYSFFVSERLPELKMKDSKAATSELMVKIGEEWNKMSEKEKKSYNKESERARSLYNLQMEEFKKNGYYTDLEKETPKTSASQKRKSQSVKKEKSKTK